jgi:mono/diheme cytochrome c family protein
MPAFGRTGMLKPPEISAAADYVRSLSGLPAPNADLTLGKKVFEDNCAVCHGTDAMGTAISVRPISPMESGSTRPTGPSLWMGSLMVVVP